MQTEYCYLYWATSFSCDHVPALQTEIYTANLMCVVQFPLRNAQFAQVFKYNRQFSPKLRKRWQGSRFNDVAWYHTNVAVPWAKNTAKAMMMTTKKKDSRNNAELFLIHVTRHMHNDLCDVKMNFVRSLAMCLCIDGKTARITLSLSLSVCVCFTDTVQSYTVPPKSVSNWIEFIKRSPRI